MLQRRQRVGAPRAFQVRTTARLAGRKRLPEGEKQLAASKDGSWVYTDRHPGSKMEIPAEGKRWRKEYVSLNLVCSYRANLGGHREIGDARAHNHLLDDRARHHWIDPRRRRYPHVFAPDKRTISSCRPHFFHTGRDPGPLHLL